jgi:hypothetical protein
MLLWFLLFGQTVATSLTVNIYSTPDCSGPPDSSQPELLNVCIPDSDSLNLSAQMVGSCKHNSTISIISYDDGACTEKLFSLDFTVGECQQLLGDSYIRFVCSGCFSSISEVTLENGTGINMYQLKENDKVLSVDKNGNLFYDNVFRVGHYDNNTMYEFIQITTQSGRSIEVSSNHYLHVDQCCDVTKLVLASEVKLYSTLYVASTYSGIVYPTKVDMLTIIRRRGAYNFHVLSGTIVVNGIVASHFTTESKWNNNAYALLWYSMLNTFLSSK